MITNCITKISRNNTDLERFIPILFEYILNKLDNIDLQSATILLNSLSRFPKFSKVTNYTLRPITLMYLQITSLQVMIGYLCV